MEWWTEAGLAAMASAIGKPLTFNLATKERYRLSYERVCVELNFNSNMPYEITVNLRGVDFIMPIIYEWKPRKCNSCHAFGHFVGKCPRTVESKVQQEEAVCEVVPNKGDEPTSMACGDVELKSFT